MLVLLIKFNNELVEREVEALAICGRLIILAPAHRGANWSVRATWGRKRRVVDGAAFLYSLATLKVPNVQRALERAGYRLLSFSPDREEVAPGVVKRVYQAVYAKFAGTRR